MKCLHCNQRVALIRTLAIKPDLLLLDEAFSALDFTTRLSVNDDVYNIIKSLNKTTIMVTHDLNEAISMADYVVVLSKGPSIVKNMYKIDLECKGSPSARRKDSKFNYYFDLIFYLLSIVLQNFHKVRNFLRQIPLFSSYILPKPIFLLINKLCKNHSPKHNKHITPYKSE